MRTLAPGTVPAGHITMEDLLSRCRAASRLAMRGDSWDAEDRADAASAVLLAVLEALPGKGATARSISARDATMTKLYGKACNARRSEELRRARDEREALKVARLEIPLAHIPAEQDELGDGTWQGAAARANDMLDAVGLPAEGPTWTLAYAAARAADGAGGAELAEELALGAAAMRQHQSRAAKKALKLRPGTQGDWGEVLEARQPTPHRSQKIDRDPRYRAGKDDAPVTTRSTRKVAPWTPTSRKRASWTVGLPINTDARLAKAASLQRARVQALSPAERRDRALSAGLPSPVR